MLHSHLHAYFFHKQFAMKKKAKTLGDKIKQDVLKRCRWTLILSQGLSGPLLPSLVHSSLTDSLSTAQHPAVLSSRASVHLSVSRAQTDARLMNN